MQEAVVFQIAALLALLGMGLAWRGVMTQYAGFYDLSLAWSHVLWGCVLGAVVATLEFQTLSSWVAHPPLRGPTCSCSCGLSACIQRPRT